MTDELGAGAYRLRPVSEPDVRLLWKWANDPAARRASFDRDLIPWEEHVTWFAGRMSNDSSFMWIMEDLKECKLGLVRFDLGPDNEAAVISIYLDEQVRGQGRGAWLIRRGCDLLAEHWGGHRVEAIVSIDNLASLRTFERAGFKDAGSVRDGGGRLLTCHLET